jgi:hypothetical protein
VTNGSGTVSGANVTDVSVTCVTDTFTVGGTVSGLDGTGLVLQNNAGDDLAIGANGGFVFSTPVTDGNGYDVTVLTQPSNLSQTCTTSDAIGTMAGSNVTNVVVSCETNHFMIGGNVSGLVPGTEVVLQISGQFDYAVGANGPFSFPTPLIDGSAYVVHVLTQPANPDQFCSVENAIGTLAGDNVTDVLVTCKTYCRVITVSDTTEYFSSTYEACEILVLGPDFIAADGSNITANSGWEINFIPGFLVEQGATLDATVCGQSLCTTSPDPMPLGCHTCVDQICDSEPFCCAVEFDQACLDKVDTICGLVCD